MLKVKLLNAAIDPDFLVAVAAKLCYSPTDIESLMEKQTPESVEKFVNILTSIGHESPIEHVSFSFAVEGVSRALTHQLVRHRIASFSQQSQRYVKLSQFEYIIPPAIDKYPSTRNIFIKAMQDDQKAYDEIVEILIHKDIEENHKDKMKEVIREKSDNDNIEHIAEHWNIPLCGISSKKWVEAFSKEYKKTYNAIEKKAIEDARYVFPNACETKIIVTMNARTLMNFFHHRCCFRAQWEIRDLAKQMLKICKDKSPVLFKKAGPSCVSGICPEGNMQCDQLKGKVPTKIDVDNLIAKHYNKKESV